MKRNHEDYGTFASEVSGLFGPDDVHLLLTGDGAVWGCEDLDGLRLVGNALYDLTFREWPPEKCERRLRGTPVEGSREAAAGRLASAREGIRRLARTAGLSFVLCYHVGGTADWGVAWSADLTQAEAVRQVLEFVESGTLFVDLAE